MPRGATYYAFFNQTSVIPALAMGVGLMNNNPTLVNRAAALFTAWIKAGIHDTGAMSDFISWADCTPECPGSMWGHQAAATSALIAIADMYARSGNTSLYDLSVSTQILGGGGGTVRLDTALDLLARMANRTTIFYGTTNLGNQVPSRILSWDTVDAIGDQGDYYYDFSSMLANMYYRDSHITTAMTRMLKKTNTSDGCYDPQFAGCFSGIWAQWADLPFMFGNMEDNASNPFLTLPPP